VESGELGGGEEQRPPKKYTGWWVFYPNGTKRPEMAPSLEYQRNLGPQLLFMVSARDIINGLAVVRKETAPSPSCSSFLDKIVVPLASRFQRLEGVIFSIPILNTMKEYLWYSRNPVNISILETIKPGSYH